MPLRFVLQCLHGNGKGWENASLAITRREFLQSSGIFAASLAAGHTHVTRIAQRSPNAAPMLDLNKLEKFVDALPIPPVVQPKGKRPNPERPSESIPHYRLAMRQITAKVHRDVKPTRCWGFENISPGPTLVSCRSVVTLRLGGEPRQANSRLASRCNSEYSTLKRASAAALSPVSAASIREEIVDSTRHPPTGESSSVSHIWKWQPRYGFLRFISGQYDFSSGSWVQLER